MKLLDHTVLRVTDQKESTRFHERIYGFRRNGEGGPFDVLRVNEHFTLELEQEKPADRIHLAFAMDRAEFDAVKSRLEDDGIPFGNGPRDRSDTTPSPGLRARGTTQTLCFDDADGHVLEIRHYDAARR